MGAPHDMWRPRTPVEPNHVDTCICCLCVDGPNIIIDNDGTDSIVQHCRDFGRRARAHPHEVLATLYSIWANKRREVNQAVILRARERLVDVCDVVDSASVHRVCGDTAELNLAFESGALLVLCEPAFKSFYFNERTFQDAMETLGHGKQRRGDLLRLSVALNHHTDQQRLPSPISSPVGRRLRAM